MKANGLGNSRTLICAVTALFGSALLGFGQKSSRVFEAPEGFTTTFEWYGFHSNTVEKTFYKNTFGRAFGNFLPYSAKRLLGVKPVGVTFEPPIPGEPVLSAAFWIERQTNAPQPGDPGGLPMMGYRRLVISDEHGNTYDPVITGGDANWGLWWQSVSPFPRRGEKLNLQIVDTTTPIARFTIPNPVPGPYPQWIPSALPVPAKDGDLAGELVQFRAIHSSGKPRNIFSIEEKSHTEVAFRLKEDGRETTDWRPVSFEVWDATGNHWKAYPNVNYARIDGWDMRAGFLGALWAGEDAWKIRVEFQQTGRFPAIPPSRFLEFIAKPEPVRLGEASAKGQ